MEYKVSKIKLSQDAALQKMRNWCAYQERSQQEARMKLLESDLGAEEVEEVIAELISENYMNEERFAIAFSGGKFRIKHWGKIKIRIELRKHKVPENMITNALNQIDPKEYILTLQKLIEKRVGVSGTIQVQKQYYDSLKYCISRGFESELVAEQVKLILKIK